MLTVQKPIGRGRGRPKKKLLEHTVSFQQSFKKRTDQTQNGPVSTEIHLNFENGSEGDCSPVIYRIDTDDGNHEQCNS